VNVLNVEDDYGLQSSNQLEEGINATPAFAGRSLLLRTKASLYRIDGIDVGSEG
jgi:hypothetical protein